VSEHPSFIRKISNKISEKREDRKEFVNVRGDSYFLNKETKVSP
jgi:hypothetical protein